MLLRGIFPKLYRRRVNLDRHIESAVEATSRVITLVETLQINRLSAFWWSCEYSTNLLWEKTLIVGDKQARGSILPLSAPSWPV